MEDLRLLYTASSKLSWSMRVEPSLLFQMNVSKFSILSIRPRFVRYFLFQCCSCQPLSTRTAPKNDHDSTVGMCWQSSVKTYRHEKKFQKVHHEQNSALYQILHILFKEPRQGYSANKWVDAGCLAWCRRAKNWHAEKTFHIHCAVTSTFVRLHHLHDKVYLCLPNFSALSGS